MYVAGHAAEKVSYFGTEKLACYQWVLEHLQYKMFSDSVISDLVLETVLVWHIFLFKCYTSLSGKLDASVINKIH